MGLSYHLELMKNFKQKDTLPQKFNNRKKNAEHYLSRYTLAKILKTEESFKSLEINNYQEVLGYPQFICSLAHTKDAAFAVIAEKSKFLGLGCDVEDKNRKIPENSDHHFINEQDDINKFNLLTKWCLKEACFKALFNSGAPIKLLKEVVIQNQNFKLMGDKELPTTNRFKIIPHPDYIQVIAYCLKKEDSVECIKAMSDM